MDAAVATWMNKADAPEADASSLLAEGLELMRAEPSLPRVVAADIHCRLAALAFITGDRTTTVRHAAHAGEMARDMTIEGQLHVLGRVIPLLAHALPPGAPADHPGLHEASRIFGDALDAVMAATDERVTRLAVLEALSMRAGTLEEHDAGAVRATVAAEATVLRGEFERVGELDLASSAAVLEKI